MVGWGGGGGGEGGSGGAKVLGKLSVPGRPPTGLDDSRARAYCACSRCGWMHVFSRLSFLFSFSLSFGDGSI